MNRLFRLYVVHLLVLTRDIVDYFQTLSDLIGSLVVYKNALSILSFIKSEHRYFGQY